MIAAVSGEVLVRRPDHVVVDAAGVGYRLNVSTETLRAVPAVGKKTSLHAHLVVRDDSMALYGFATEDERDLFLLLTSVSGVGPKVAVAALSAGSVRDLLTAIAAEDAKRFQAVPGIGKRTAERIILELREKVAGELSAAVEAGGADAPPTPAASDARSEAREGLLGLGYTPIEAERLLDAVSGETAEELINAALRAGAGAGSAGAADRSAA
jgi:Holliday junction DNA helicase RuvA